MRLVDRHWLSMTRSTNGTVSLSICLVVARLVWLRDAWFSVSSTTGRWSAQTRWTRRLRGPPLSRGAIGDGTRWRATASAPQRAAPRPASSGATSRPRRHRRLLCLAARPGIPSPPTASPSPPTWALVLPLNRDQPRRLHLRYLQPACPLAATVAPQEAIYSKCPHLSWASASRACTTPAAVARLRAWASRLRGTTRLQEPVYGAPPVVRRPTRSFQASPRCPGASVSLRLHRRYLRTVLLLCKYPQRTAVHRMGRTRNRLPSWSRRRVPVKRPRPQRRPRPLTESTTPRSTSSSTTLLFTLSLLSRIDLVTVNPIEKGRYAWPTALHRRRTSQRTRIRQVHDRNLKDRILYAALANSSSRGLEIPSRHLQEENFSRRVLTRKVLLWRRWPRMIARARTRYDFRATRSTIITSTANEYLRRPLSNLWLQQDLWWTQTKSKNTASRKR